jgi:hypothetical protein
MTEVKLNLGRHSVPTNDDEALYIVQLWIERLPKTKSQHDELWERYLEVREKLPVLDAWLKTLKEFS